MMSATRTDEDVFYDAIIRKDSSFEGVFFTAVKTTGIFCRPTCNARKPKRENVEFFSTSREAITKGYRPCKVCRPLENLDETPQFIKDILQVITDEPSRKFKDYDLVQIGVEPSKVRRWFLKNHGITFHAYQRMYRINSAFKRIQDGEKISSAAFDTGYESLSGFNDSFKSIFGVSPRQSRSTSIIDLKRIETPLGTMIACAVKDGICLLEFSDRRMLETEFKTLAKILNATIVQGSNKHFETLETQLAEYFAGKRKDFTVPIFTPGTVFQNTVWKALQDIKYGTTSTYRKQAIAVNQPLGVRAVANANGMNRISILVPCHRVIGSDGALTGYGGGLWRKQWLLDHEKKSAL